MFTAVFAIFARIALFIVAGILGAVAEFVIVFIAAQFEKDPTAGGAYFALAVLLSPVGFLIGGLLSLLIKVE